MKRIFLLLAIARPAAAEPCAWPEVCDDATVRDTLDAGWLARTGLGDSSIDQDAARAIGAPSPLEQRWLVDGVPADGVALGPGFAIPLRFVDRLDVVGAGVGADARVATAGAVDAHLRSATGPVHEASVWGRIGPPHRALPDVPDVYTPMRLSRDFERGVDADLLAGNTRRGLGWWLVGLSMRTYGDGLTRTSHRLRDADGDGRYDRNPDGTLVTEPIDTRHYADPAAVTTEMLRVGGHGLVLTGLFQQTLQDRRAAVGTPTATLVDQRDRALLAIAAYRATIAHAEVTVTGAWHREHTFERGDDHVQIGTAYIPAPADLPDDAAVAAACADAAGAQLPSCPVPTGYYVRGGAGLLTSAIADTPSLTIELARAFGGHRLDAGVTGEDARRVVTRRFTGGRLERRLAETIVFESYFVDPSGGPDSCGDLGPCTFLPHATRTYRTRYLAAWADDAWTPTPGLRLDGGLRWESMQVGTALGFTDEVAPRLSFVYRPTPHARVFAGFTRAFALLPLTFAPTVIGDSPIYTHLDSPIGTSDTLQSSRTAIASDARAPHVDSVVAGAEWIALERVDVGVAVTSTTLWDGLDDAGQPVAGDGRGGDELRVWLGNAPDAAMRLRVAYVRTSEKGSCDLPPYECPSERNGVGRLPLDLPNRFFAEVAHAHARGAWTFDAGARFAVSSGTPVGAFAGDVALLPRGAVGRMPTQSSITVHGGATRGSVTFSIDAVDLLDRRTAAAVDERWTLDRDVAPIDGGSAADLVWLRGPDGALVHRNPAFGTATRYTVPLSLRIGLSSRF